MPKAILALRSYPLAVIMALILFACSFVIATSSIGTIGNGGDEGSGMGGTGRSGGFSGDSGFGGTGGPSPFVGSSDSDLQDSVEQTPENVLPMDSLIEPFVRQMQETVRIPDDLRPLIELQRTPLEDPSQQNNPDSLHMLNDSSSELPPGARRLLDMAEADESRVAPTLELQLRIPEASPASINNIEPYQMELARQPAADPENGASGDEIETDSQSESSLTSPLLASPLLESLQLESQEEPGSVRAEEIADHSDETVQEDIREQNADAEGRPMIPERIQRPELPPFQRMRPAVDRASITPPRVQPMRI